MGKKIFTLKNLIWTIAVAVCVLAVVIGFLFAALSPYNGSKDTPIIVLGDSASQTQKKETGFAQKNDIIQSAEFANGSLNELGETADAGQAYVDSLTFLTDSRMIGLRDYGILTGGSDNKQVWGTSSGSIMVNSMTTSLIVNPSDSSSITIEQAAMIIRPETLYISIGNDGLNSTTEEQFKENYRTVIKSIQTASPSTTIVCCAVLPVSETYNGVDGLNATIMSDGNDWVKDICAELGLYYLDIRDAVSDGSGFLSVKYCGSNGKTLNTQGLDQILLFIRSHSI